jgi:hypothetical protein
MEYATGIAASLCLDIRLANDAAVVIVLPAKTGSKICAAYPHWKETLRDKLRLNPGRL